MLNWLKPPKPDPDNQPGLEVTVRLRADLVEKLAVSLGRGYRYLPWAVLLGLSLGISGAHDRLLSDWFSGPLPNGNPQETGGSPEGQ
jgi:hypothetical protein